MRESALDALITALRRLPGVGIKSAQRMAFHLLQHDRDGADQLATALQRGLSAIHNCARCQTFTEDEICRTCLDSARDASLLCVVESPADQAAMERSGSYRGLYFVLMGRLSPLDGMGARDIGLETLLSRAADPQVAEVILATSFTAEGDITAHVIADTLRSRGIPSTRIARGVPIGSELEHVDAGTIAHALHDRR